MLKKTILIFGLFVLQGFCLAQKQGQLRIDSLEAILSSVKEDTTRINILNILGWEVRESAPNKAIAYNNRSLALITKLLKQKNSAYLSEWLQLASSAIYNNFGVLNNVITSDPKKALEYHFKALAIRESLLNSNYKWIVFKSRLGLGDTYKNIGSVYSGVNADTAVMYLSRSLPLLTETGDKRGVSLVYLNFGNISMSRGDYKKALGYYNQALEIGEEIGNKRTIAIACLSIGDIYCTMDETLPDNKDHAYINRGLEYYFKALKVSQEDHNKKWQWNTLVSIEGAYRVQKKFSLAKEFGLKALQIATEINFMSDIADSHLYLSQVYSEAGDYRKAFQAFSLYSRINDSLTSIKLNTQVEDVKVKYNEDKQHREAELKNKLEQAEINNELEKQKQMRNFFISGLLLMFVFAAVIFRAFRVSSRQNKIIAEQKDLVEKQKAAVDLQKHLVEEKNKEITDSIEYALRIQTAILPPKKTVRQHLERSFILYKPKDIVAGDFYWMESAEDLVIFAACDCTGHGVPGAMVSVVCNNALNRSVREFGLLQPAALLNKTAEIVIENFSQSEEAIKDGMDISICSYNKKTRMLEWAGANNPLWLIQNGVLTEVKADKRSIGNNDNNIPFANHSFLLDADTAIYIFSDGFADQFGGENEKKFTRKRFKELLLSVQHLPMEEQGAILEKAITTYRKDVEQTDDILVIGVKL